MILGVVLMQSSTVTARQSNPVDIDIGHFYEVDEMLRSSWVDRSFSLILSSFAKLQKLRKFLASRALLFMN